MQEKLKQKRGARLGITQTCGVDSSGFMIARRQDELPALTRTVSSLPWQQAAQFPPAHLHHPQAARARGGGAVRDDRGGFEIEAAAPKSPRCDEAAKARDARPGRRALQAPSEPEAQPASGADPASRLTRAETAVANRRSSALGGKEVGAMGRSFAIHGG